MSFLPCVGKNEASKRPLCGLLRPNSNLDGENHGIITICVSFPISIITLRRSLHIWIVTLYIWRDSWTLINEIASHFLYK